MSLQDAKFQRNSSRISLPPNPRMRGGDQSALQKLLKEELRMTIMAKRLARGEGELTVEVRNPESYELTEAELERKERRREQNRRAAQRCRRKKRLNQMSVLQNYDWIISRNDQLQQEVDQLRKDNVHLRARLRAHRESCTCSGNAQSLPPPPPKVKVEPMDESSPAAVGVGDGYVTPLCSPTSSTSSSYSPSCSSSSLTSSPSLFLGPASCHVGMGGGGGGTAVVEKDGDVFAVKEIEDTKAALSPSLYIYNNNSSSSNNNKCLQSQQGQVNCLTPTASPTPQQAPAIPQPHPPTPDQGVPMTSDASSSSGQCQQPQQSQQSHGCLHAHNFPSLAEALSHNLQGHHRERLMSAVQGAGQSDGCSNNSKSFISHQNQNQHHHQQQQQQQQHQHQHYSQQNNQRHFNLHSADPSEFSGFASSSFGPPPVSQHQQQVTQQTQLLQQMSFSPVLQYGSLSQMEELAFMPGGFRSCVFQEEAATPLSADGRRSISSVSSDLSAASEHHHHQQQQQPARDDVKADVTASDDLSDDVSQLLSQINQNDLIFQQDGVLDDVFCDPVTGMTSLPDNFLQSF